jgi:predicted alpha/beta-hydrolase family hydrolase
VVALAFPLHPPWKPERSRFDELASAGVPTLVVQGERDGFGEPGEFPDGDHQMVAIPYANHGMAVPKAHDQDAALGLIADAVTSFIQDHFQAS